MGDTLVNMLRSDLHRLVDHFEEFNRRIAADNETDDWLLSIAWIRAEAEAILEKVPIIMKHRRRSRTPSPSSIPDTDDSSI